jgi:hypothetical protein
MQATDHYHEPRQWLITHIHPSIRGAFLVLPDELHVRAYLIVFNDSRVDVSCTRTTSIRRITVSGYQLQTNAHHLTIDLQERTAAHPKPRV